MKKKIIIFLLLFSPNYLLSQTVGPFTLKFSPSYGVGVDATISKRNDGGITENTNYWQNSISIISNPSNNEFDRSLISFPDLNQLPAGTIIHQAKLVLRKVSVNGVSQFKIQRVISNWSDTVVTWNGQPSATENDMVIIDPNTFGDYVEADITQIVQAMFNEGSINNGLLIKLENEDLIGSVVFGSSESEDESLRPVLELSISTLCTYSYKYTYPSTIYKGNFPIKKAQDANVCERTTGGGSATNNNFNSVFEMNPTNWTWNGNGGRIRSFIEFRDVSSFIRLNTNNLKIAQARLFLNGVSSSLVTPQGNCRACAENSWNMTDNSCVVQGVVAPWDETTITWNNAPGINGSVSGYIMPSQSTFNWNAESIDVTNVLQSMVQNPALANGFRISMSRDVVPTSGQFSEFRSLVFAGASYPIEALQPRLEIVWAFGPISEETIVLQPGSVAGKDAQIKNYRNSGGNGNYGNTDVVSVGTWRSGSGSNYEHCYERSLISFDLSSLPPNAFLTSAEISLYATGTNTNSGSTGSWIKRVTNTWQENTITWNNQPQTTDNNQIWIPQHTSNNYNVTLNVTRIFQDILKSGNNNGILLRLSDETWSSGAGGSSPNRWMGFASSDHATPLKRPKLVLKYIIPCTSPIPYSKGASLTDSLKSKEIELRNELKKTNSLKESTKAIEKNQLNNYQIEIFPNPVANRNFTARITASEGASLNVRVIDVNGNIIQRFNESTLKQNVNEQMYYLSQGSAGLYFVVFTIDGKSFVKRIVVN